MSQYDAIVLGTGGVGSAAACHLARRGAKVLGIDRFPGGHDRGSSHGETRIIRQAYYEHPDYVPLLLRSYELWRELEKSTGSDLLHQVGLLQIGPPGGTVVSGVLESARQHELKVERFAASEIHRYWPGFRVPDGLVGVFEAAGGYLRIERCVLAHLEAAKKHGAEFRFGVAARSFRTSGGTVTVELESGEQIRAGRLVIAAGPWAPELLENIGVHLVVRRKHVYWFPTKYRYYQEAHNCPTFLFELPYGIFYGFPQIDDLGVKTCEHSGGQIIHDPLNDPRALDTADLTRVDTFLAAYLPGVGRPMKQRSVCFYTMSPDEHFVVDKHPEHDGVLFAAGLSGHGFKFTPVLGEVLADLALEGRTRWNVGFLGLDRFQSETKSGEREA